MSNKAKANGRAKRLAKARNMRKNNGIGRTLQNQHIHELADTQKSGGLGSRLAAGFKGIFGK